LIKKIQKKNWFDKYEKRPEYLKYISLAQFVSKYYKNNKGDYVLREEPKVMRYRNYDMGSDYNEYRREMVTLHLPFRHEEQFLFDRLGAIAKKKRISYLIRNFMRLCAEQTRNSEKFCFTLCII